MSIRVHRGLFVGGHLYTVAPAVPPSTHRALTSTGLNGTNGKPIVPDRTMTYEIVEFQPGTTIQRSTDNTKWQVPSGHDTTRTAVTTPVDFVGPSQNLATIQKRYGRFMDRDIICPLVVNEMYAALNALRWVRFTIGAWWSNDENNYAFAAGDFGGVAGDGDACAKAQALWLSTGLDSGTEIRNTAPFARGTCYWDGSYSESQIERMYSYAQFTFGCKPLRFAISVDFWNKAIPLCSTSGPWPATVCTFDAMGDAVANGTFVKWDGQGPTLTDFWQSAALGSLATPDCPACFDAGAFRSQVKGWQISEAYAIVKGNVVGGFTQTTTTDGS